MSGKETRKETSICRVFSCLLYSVSQQLEVASIKDQASFQKRVSYVNVSRGYMHVFDGIKADPKPAYAERPDLLAQAEAVVDTFPSASKGADKIAETTESRERKPRRKRDPR